MSQTMPPTEPSTGKRHPWVDQFCAHLDAAIAEPTLRSLGAFSSETEGCLVLLPSFVWMSPLIDVGRKDRGPGETKYLLPVRVTYSCGPVLAMEPGETEIITFAAKGMGHDLTSTVIVQANTRTAMLEIVHGPTGLPVTIVAGTTVNLHRSVHRALSAANEGRWQAAQMLHQQAELGMHQAASYLKHSVSATQPGIGLDPHIFGRAMSELLIGSDSEDRSPILRLVDSCTRPEAFVRVDPLRYTSKAISRDAVQVLSRIVGDPRFGPKLRALLTDMPTDTSPAYLAAEYNARHPNRRPISVDGARAAMELELPLELPGGADPLGFDDDSE